MWQSNIDNAAYLAGIKREYCSIYCCCYYDWCVLRHESISCLPQCLASHTRICYLIPFFFRWKVLILHLFIQPIKGHTLTGTDTQPHTHRDVSPSLLLCTSAAAAPLIPVCFASLRTIGVSAAPNLCFNKSVRSQVWSVTKCACQSQRHLPSSCVKHVGQINYIHHAAAGCQYKSH